MVAEFSSKFSKNGERFDVFVKKAKENKKFKFTLDGRTYVSDEYEIDGVMLWRIFKNEKDIVPMNIFLSFDEFMEQGIFESLSFPQRFEDMDILEYA